MILPSGFSTTDYSVTGQDKGWGAGWETCDAINSGRMKPVAAQRSGALILGGMHEAIAPLSMLLIDEIERRGYMMVPGWCWGAECRQISGTSIASNHSWGLAMDINAPNNPYTSSGVHDIPDWAYALLRSYGFGLGADYTGQQDWMHAEFMGTPSDAVIMTALAINNLTTTDWFDMATRADLDASTAAQIKALVPGIVATAVRDTLATVVDIRNITHAIRAESQTASRLVGQQVTSVGALIQADLALEKEDRPFSAVRQNESAAIFVYGPGVFIHVPGTAWAAMIRNGSASGTVAQVTADELDQLQGTANPEWKDQGQPQASIVAAQFPLVPPVVTQQYTVVAGDSWDAIAARFGTDRAGLLKLNPTVTDVNNITIGQVLTVPKV